MDQSRTRDYRVEEAPGHAGFLVFDPVGRPVHRSDKDHSVYSYEAAHTLANSLHHKDQIDRLEQSGQGFMGIKTVTNLTKGLIWGALKSAVPPLGHAHMTARVLQQLAPTAGRVHEDHQRLALAAKLAYAPDKRHLIPGYRPDLSDQEIAVWVPEDKQPVVPIIAFRGTAGNDDVSTDMSLSVGRLEKTARWKRTLKHLARLERAFGLLGGAPAEFTGHSLGGTLAVHAAARYSGAVPVVFNPGAGTGQYPKHKDGEAGTVYSVRGDVVSGLTPIRAGDHNVVVLEPTTRGNLDGSGDPLSAHDSGHFLTDEQHEQLGGRVDLREAGTLVASAAAPPPGGSGRKAFGHRDDTELHRDPEWDLDRDLRLHLDGSDPRYPALTVEQLSNFLANRGVPREPPRRLENPFPREGAERRRYQASTLDGRFWLDSLAYTSAKNVLRIGARLQEGQMPANFDVPERGQQTGRGISDEEIRRELPDYAIPEGEAFREYNRGLDDDQIRIRAGIYGLPEQQEWARQTALRLREDYVRVLRDAITAFEQTMGEEPPRELIKQMLKEVNRTLTGLEIPVFGRM